MNARVECYIVTCEGWTFDSFEFEAGNPPFRIASFEGGDWDGESAFGINPPEGDPSEINVARILNATGTSSTTFEAGDFSKSESSGPSGHGSINEFVVSGVEGENFFWVSDASHLFLFRAIVAQGDSTEFRFAFFADDAPKGPSNVGANSSIAPVPLPGAGLLLMSAVGGIAFLRRRGQRTA